MRVVALGYIQHSGKKYTSGMEFVCSRDDGERLIRLGRAKEIGRKKTNIRAELEAVAKELGIETDGKSFEELKDAVELAKEVRLE